MFTLFLEGPPCDKRFWDLMDGIGTKTDLTGFSGYLGDMGNKGLTYTGNWKVFIFFVSLCLKFEIFY